VKKGLNMNTGPLDDKVNFIIMPVPPLTQYSASTKTLISDVIAIHED